MLRPFSRTNTTYNVTEVVFNYRLFRARRVIENLFGILAARFRILKRPIIADIQLVKYITRTTVCLHNFLMKVQHPHDIYTFRNCERRDVEIVNEGRLTTLNNQQGSNNYTRQAKEVRDHFKEYFNNSGAVPWQQEMITRTF